MASTIRPHGGRPVETRGRPLGEGRAVMILIHGRGGAPTNILDFVPVLDHPEVTFLAPAAAGNTWYPKSFLAPIKENEPGITSGVAVIHGLVDEALAAGVPSDRILLLGFSQGACLAATAAQRRPMRYGGVIIWSGGLIGPPGSTWSEEGSFDRTPVFLGCAAEDPHIPEERVHASAAVFERMGATVTKQIYPAAMGHMVNGGQMVWARELLASRSTALRLI
jgi:predicted esterase